MVKTVRVHLDDPEVNKYFASELERLTAGEDELFDLEDDYVVGSEPDKRAYKYQPKNDEKLYSKPSQ